MERYRIPVLDSRETKKMKQGVIHMPKRYVLRYSRMSKDMRGKEGVSIILNKELTRVIY